MLRVFHNILPRKQIKLTPPWVHGMRIYLETYGCWLNRAESAVMEDILRERGHTIVDRVEIADAVVINTCAVRIDTERRILRRLRELRRLALAKGIKVVVAGCLAKARPGLLTLEFPEASLVAPDALEEIVEAIEEEGRVVMLGEGERRRLPRYRGGVMHAVPIASGCTGACSFCIGKIARPRLRSYNEEDIINNVRNAVEAGAKEIFLTAQDAASYGLDLGSSLPRLIRRILGSVTGKYRIRVGMMEPHLVSKFLDELLEIYSDPRMYRFIHLPVQSGDDRVLKLMNRRYTVREYIEMVKRIRRMYPDMMLVTDIIVGFPGEDEEAFENTYKLVEMIQPDKVNLARYGVRPGTLAATMPQVPEEVKVERTRKLTELIRRIRLKRNMELVGKIVETLVLETRTEKGFGRANNYKPVMFEPSDGLNPGDFVHVRIIRATPSLLIGEALI